MLFGCAAEFGFKSLIEIDLNDETERVRVGITTNKATENSSHSKARFVKVVCHSSGKEAVLRVPPTVNTVMDGIAWTFGIDSKEYNPIKEA